MLNLSFKKTTEYIIRAFIFKNRAPGGKVAKRDIVQFVEMNKFLTPGGSGGGKGYDKVALAKHVLQEVPNQVAGYMLMRGLTPDSVRKSRN